LTDNILMIRARENSIGAWVFLIGVVLAISIGILSGIFFDVAQMKSHSSAIYAILVILGLIVGFSINAQGRDAQTFLITGAILVLISKFGMESVTGSLIGIGVGDIVASTFAALLTLFVPATIIVALKVVFGLAKI
jgi:xanthosine utilization system XapX-like protein